MLGDTLIREKNFKFICLDFETESLNNYSSRPWQAGWVVGNRFKDELAVDRKIKWDNLSLSRGAARITGFHNIDMRGAVPFEKVAPDLLKFINDKEYLIVGHNFMRFDSEVLKLSLERVGIKIDWWDFFDRIIDTFALSKAYRLQMQPPQKLSSIDRVLWQSKILQMDNVSKCSLGAMAKEFNIDIKEGSLHDAIYDVKVNSELFRKLIKVINV